MYSGDHKMMTGGTVSKKGQTIRLCQVPVSLLYLILALFGGSCTGFYFPEWSDGQVFREALRELTLMLRGE